MLNILSVSDLRNYNEELAVKTIQEIYARIENIQQFPYMGADLAKRVSFRTDYKYVICGNYVVYTNIDSLVVRKSLVKYEIVLWNDYLFLLFTYRTCRM